MSNKFDPVVQDRIGKRRFKGGIDNDITYYNNVKGLQDRLLNNLPSNYTKSRSLNIGLFFDVIARELGFVQQSASDISEDKYHESTRIEYLFQILGDSLFLGENSINKGLTDVSYREFLIACVQKKILNLVYDFMVINIYIHLQYVRIQS